MYKAGFRTRVFWAGAITALVLSGCSGSSSDETRSMSLEFQTLEPLGDDFDYEGWLIVDGAPISTGKFDVDANSVPTPATFEVNEEDAESATKFVLTIEPVENDPAGPSDTKILAGDIAQGATPTATLSIADAAALGDDFTTAAGGFILATPSTAATDADNNLGIWFLDPTAGPASTLTLPTLPAGWVYEGWVVGADGPVTTGRFTDVAAADSDGAGPTAGPDGTPPFPGQDFINPAVDLTSSHTAVLTIEPEPDNAAGPFTMKPLVQAIGTDTAPTVQIMGNNAAATNPTGSVVIR